MDKKNYTCSLYICFILNNFIDNIIIEFEKYKNYRKS